MAEGDSPTVARLRVRRALREARDGAELTQAQVAEELEWSLSKVIRIENGDVTISVGDLRNLLNLLGVRDKDRVNSLLADARLARARQRAAAGWWQEGRFRELASDHLRKFVEYEAEASKIRSFNIFYVPGPLQTPDYGTALTGTWVEEVDDFTREKVRVLVDARRRRREGLMARGGSLEYLILVDQSVLLRTFGGAELFARQLRQIVELCSGSLFKLRMLPFDLGVAIANNGSFELATVGAGLSAHEVLYRENGVGDEIVETPAETKRHRIRFDQLWSVAATEGDTLAYVKQRINELEATR
ncbi:helix-turn-helix transcriptional regulator [Actinoplanes sp. NPDC049596]|uniref:helix-turn-helix domain-containing protein n=1 Tax=unclassified Actinoplanes TaxID=2626549 RepID=UPI00343297AF